MQPDHSFADIAVALTLLSSKTELDLAKTRMIADRIGLSKMGLQVIVDDLVADAVLVREAIEIFKQLAESEPEVRALLARKRTGRWISQMARAAV